MCLGHPYNSVPQFLQRGGTPFFFFLPWTLGFAPDSMGQKALIAVPPLYVKTWVHFFSVVCKAPYKV
jgi:hypothetical protein